VAHALPAADGTVALMALDAEAAVARRLPDSSDALDWIPLAALFRGPAQSAIDSTRELLTSIRFRALGNGEASAFKRVMRPQGVALPILGMAVRVRLDGDGSSRVIQDVAISAGPVAPVPYRAFAAEEFLRGKTVDENIMREAAQLLLSSARPRTSAHRATKEYRFELLPMLFEQTLQTALERAARDE
jgi:carbon-monoxide dehydrogenase medium subunit